MVIWDVLRQTMIDHIIKIGDLTDVKHIAKTHECKFNHKTKKL